MVTLDRAVPATHATLLMEASELSNLESSNTGKVFLTFQLHGIVSNGEHTITSDQIRPAAESPQSKERHVCVCDDVVVCVRIHGTVAAI